MPAVGIIVSLLPDGVKKIVSPFFGGGSVEIACAKELNIYVIGYDILDSLV
jgi:site-specific DNA-adenine methylase